MNEMNGSPPRKPRSAARRARSAGETTETWEGALEKPGEAHGASSLAEPWGRRSKGPVEPDHRGPFTEGAAATKPYFGPESVAFSRSGPLRQTASYPVEEPLEDTSDLLLEPEQRTFYKRQPAWFWLLCALLMISLFTVVLIIGINALKEGAAQRAEEKRLQDLANEKAKYKYLYRDEIESFSIQQGVDPALVAAMIYNESRFDPGAESAVGARGLMQIMDDTGEWIAGKLGESGSYTFDSLFEPEKNLRYGIWYVGFLARLFEGNLVKMVAGYHAGQNAVTGWLSDPRYSKDGVTLSVIPYGDTEQYVKKVVSAYAIYIKHYYPPEEPKPQTDEHPA